MSDVTIVTASIATVVLQGPIYGIFIALFAISTFCFVRRAMSMKTRKGPIRALWRMPLFIASVAMFCTIPADFVVSIIRVLQAFVYFQGGRAPELFKFFINLSHWATTVTQSLIIGTLAVGDMVLVYRIFVVYQGNVIAILVPIMTLLTSSACAIAESVKYSRFKLGDDVVTYVSSHVITGGSSLTLANNCLCSALIIYRVWRIRAATRTTVSDGGTCRRVLFNAVQGAGLYAFWALLFVITINTSSNISWAVWDTWAEVTGVAFMLVNVHALLNTEELKFVDSHRRVLPLSTPHPWGREEIGLRQYRFGGSYSVADSSRPSLSMRGEA